MKRTRTKLKAKEKYFIKNGAILLEKQISLIQGQIRDMEPLKLFSAKDIEQATSTCNPPLILNTSYATVCRASLDGLTVAIKGPPVRESRDDITDLLLTEAATRQVISHKNMVSIYGCCLESQIPILVYKFMPRGMLSVSLHSDVADRRKSLTWSVRLRIASEISYALSYMHNALPKPIVHRDVQSANIILDETFNSKLSNFGHSVSITPGETLQLWPLEGSPGYIDPEYMETLQVTDKCDVYSFGVLMLELLTGRQPSLMSLDGLDMVAHVMSFVERDDMLGMVDNKLLDGGNHDEIEKFAELALRCVAKKGTERPSMMEVVKKLWQIRRGGS